MHSWRDSSVYARARNETHETVASIKYTMHERDIHTNVGDFCVRLSASTMPSLNEANHRVHPEVKRETRPLQYGRSD